MIIFRKSKLISISLVFVLIATACSKPSGTSIPLEKRQDAAAKMDERIILANNSFGMQLHRQLVKSEQDKKKNIVISPTSVSLAFAMTYNGSRGETQASMAKTLGWQGMSLDEINQGNETLSYLLQQPGSGVKVQIANSLWSRKGTSIRKEFMRTNESFYDAKVTELDFNSPKAPDTINEWVNKNTNGKISKMLESINPNEVLILMNAIYFNGGWKKEFQLSGTKEESFKLQDGSTKQVKMMAQTGSYEYLQEGGFQAIRLPYGEGQMDMLVILPGESSSLGALHDKLWADPDYWNKSFHSSRGEIKLPRFKIEYSDMLNEPLKAMGMTLPFDADHADFSGIAPVPPNLFISSVTHKTFIEVNEKGTEAAAITSVQMAGASAPIDEPFQMTINRPFFFAIEDRQTGLWLFVGSVVEP
ncbi:serpin family protein [Paenibacillus qinlingensis]|uniref:serpin family protein n=1 Tax=Paenibacillus qinlingensis TaxID=1837343 RepID=UPI001565BBD2|nr:serpin family protein [Paenibacillus qinlingensis]NQX58118.1 serpin family protein [Paenibacillus qinlingensis]